MGNIEEPTVLAENNYSMSRRRKHRKSRKKLAYWVTAVFFIFLCFLIYFSLHQSNRTSEGNATPRVQAAIVDHLNFTGQSNPAFVEECINILKSGRLTWKYYRGEDVTVDFYRNLTSYGSSLIILRVHSAIMKTEEGAVSILGLFTSERYYGPEDAYAKYPEDVADRRLVEAFFSPEERAQNISYFGIVPKFVEKSMIGEFKDTVVIMMGCEGLGYINTTGARVPYTDMAEAFRKRGAKVYIGWDGPIGVNHTDQATLDLLQSLILEKRTIKEAVEEVDTDPDYESVLKFYPEWAGSYVIPNLRSSLTMNVAYNSPAPKAFKRTKYLARE